MVLGSIWGRKPKPSVAAEIIEAFTSRSNDSDDCSACINRHLWLIGVEDYSAAFAPFEHLELNPLTAVVILSGLEDHVFRFSQARKEIIALDKEQPLPQPNHDESE